MTNEFQLKSIRPKVILEMLEEQFPDENISANFLIPSSKIGSLRLIESALLVSLVKMLDAKVMFEFGTFMGATSVLLASNSHHNSKVYTLDISEEELAKLNEKDSRDSEIRDNFLRDVRIEKSAQCILKTDKLTQNKIVQLLQNSHHFSPREHKLVSICDIIFIDGGHDTETVTVDTNNALDMRSDKGAIIWHDYNSPFYDDVTKLLNSHHLKNEILFIEDTQMAIYWPRLNKYLEKS